MKLPYMQFWVFDWLTDESVTRMSLAHQGAYFRLLCHQWVEGSIPAEPFQIADLLFGGESDAFPPWAHLREFMHNGESPSGFWGALTDGRYINYFEEYLWPAIGPHFVLHDDGRLRNKRLAKLREDAIKKADKTSASRSVAGSKGALAKASKAQAKLKQSVSKSASASDDASSDVFSDASKDGREGQNGGKYSSAVEELRNKLEGAYDRDEKLYRELHKWVGCGHTKAQELYSTLREPKRETFEAWKAFAVAGAGKVGTVGKMSSHAHPSEVEPEIQPKRRKTAQELASEERKADIARFYGVSQ